MVRVGRLGVGVVIASCALVSDARAGLDSCATSWGHFSGPDGFVSDYTYLGGQIRDHEQAGDPSNGGTGVNPDWIDISSASSSSPPGPESSVSFGYYDGGTVWDPDDPVTMEDDFIFFRMRIGADPRDNSAVGLNSFHWNVLFDINDDGYKDYWIDVEGSYASNGNPDRVQILYDPAHTQLIASADAARVEQFTARASTDSASCGGAGYSHTRTYPVGDGSGDWFLEVQVPMTAFNDASGNQLLFPDSPVAFVFTTGASNQDPLQKDHMMDLNFITSNDPITFGDVVTPSGLPSIEFTDADLKPAAFYGLGGEVYLLVSDRLANQDSNVTECITVTVTDPASGDDELVSLCETGPATGIFTNRGGLCAVTSPQDPASSPTAEAWLTDLRAYTTTFAASWRLVYETAGGGRWRVEYSTNGGSSWTALSAPATAGTPYTAIVSGLNQLSFTVRENGPDAGDVISLCTTAGDRLPTSAAPGADDDGEVSTGDGRTLYVSYTNAAHYTVTDQIPILGPCGALVQFTRATGLVTDEYDLTSDPATSDRLYVTVTAPWANTDPTTVQTIQVTLASTRAGGDTQTLVLTETGVNTGIFRNTTGLPTVIASGSYPVAANNGRWEDVDIGTVTASLAYSCGGSSLTATTTATLFTTPGGGRVEFINGAGTAEQTLYGPGAPVWVQVSDTSVVSTCVSPPYASGTVRVTVTSSAGDSETLTLYETAPGSGIFRNERYDLVTAAGSAVVTSATAGFTALGLVPGGPFAIATGPDVGLYTIASVDSATQLTLTQALTATRTGIAFSPSPLLTGTHDGAHVANDGILEGVHQGDLQVAYTDCDDGDADPANDAKTDTAVYNAPALVVNRVLFAPDSPATCQQEMVEVFNQTAAPVNATGYTVRDEDDELDYAIPQLGGSDIVLQPGERIVISIGGYFTDFAAGGVYYLFTGSNDPADVLPNWLGGPGDADPADQVTLTDPLGEIVDYVGWNGAASPSIDFLGDDAGAVLAAIWQDDAYRDTSGAAFGQVLARSSDGIDTNRPEDWLLAADSTCQTMIDAYALTRATIRGLRVDRAGLVEFATGTQQGSASFRVWGADDLSGSRLSPLDDAPAPAMIRDSVTPLLYRIETLPVTQPFVLVQETDVRGLSRLMGPFGVGDRRLEAQLERIEAHLESAGAGEPARGLRLATGEAAARLARSLAPPRRVAAPRSLVPRRDRGPAARTRAHGVKVRVSAPGTVEVPLAALGPHGAPRNPSLLRVTAQGKPVRFRIGRDGQGRRALRFEGETLSTDYTGENVYLVTWDGRPVSTVPLTRSGDEPWPGWTRVEKSFAYVPSLPREADPWQWDVLVTGWGPWPYDWWDPAAGTFDLPVQVPRGATSVSVALRLVGFSAHTHTVEARINGMSVGSVTFEGTRSVLLTGEIPAALLAASGNRLELDYGADVADPGSDYGVVYFDHIDFGARPEDRAARGRWELEPWNPTIRAPRADYLIVTHRDFAAAAERIARAKEAEGLRTVVVDVERAYDAYSAGIPEANAVKALIRDLARRGLRYVLLVGDDTFDRHDYVGTGAVSFVPSLMAFDGVWGRVPSENLYADVDDDSHPDLAIGRLPVQTPSEADALADKIANQAALLAGSAGRHLMAVDNSTPSEPQFIQDALSVPLPPGAAVAWANVGEGVGKAREDLLAALEEGAQVTHYFGHGGPEVWADEWLLAVWDVPALAAAKPTVLFTWACQSQWYLNLWGPSLNEALLLLPRAGAVASFGPAGITTPRQQRALARRVYAHFLSEGLTLGEAIRQAKSGALAEDDANQPAVDGWNLLGDPALRLSGYPAGGSTRRRHER